MRVILSCVLHLVVAIPLCGAGSHEQRRQRIESNLVQPVPIEGVAGPSLNERMSVLDVPAISYAIIEDGRVVTAAAVGLADVDTSIPATTSTMFQAASISKPVTALATMDLVERGELQLDVPVNSLLRSWQLPENELTAKRPVTLRMLLSHTGGTTVHGFPGYASDVALPSLQQVLAGEKPANTAALVVDLEPGTKFRYSGGGTTLMQAVLVDQTNMRFPELMRRTVLTPLGMRSSSYEQPLPSRLRPLAASAHDSLGRRIKGKWHIYPEMAAAGLWTTPSDLAKVVIEMQNALAGRDTQVLSLDAAQHMLQPPLGELSQGMGLGFGIQVREGAKWFTHSGSNKGFRAILIGSVEGGQGAVVMTNSDNGAPVAMQLLNTIAAEYGWKGHAKTPLLRGELSGDDAARVTGRYRLPKGDVVAVRSSASGPEVLDLTVGWQVLYPLEDGVLARSDREIRYRPEGDALHVIENAGSPRESVTAATRLAPDAPLTAEELLADGQYELARAAYGEKFHEDEASVPQPALSRAAYGMMMMGRTEQGLTLLEISTELRPSSINAWDDLAEGRQRMGDTEGAIAAYEEVVRRADGDTSVTDERREFLKRNALNRIERMGGR